MFGTLISNSFAQEYAKSLEAQKQGGTIAQVQEQGRQARLTTQIEHPQNQPLPVVQAAPVDTSKEDAAMKAAQAEMQKKLYGGGFQNPATGSIEPLTGG
jgi:hypothetical protein